MTSTTKTGLINLGVIEAEIDERADEDHVPEGEFLGDNGNVYKILSEPTDAEITHQLLIMQYLSQKSMDNAMQFFKNLAIFSIGVSVVAGLIAIIAVLK